MMSTNPSSYESFNTMDTKLEHSGPLLRRQASNYQSNSNSLTSNNFNSSTHQPQPQQQQSQQFNQSQILSKRFKIKSKENMSHNYESSETYEFKKLIPLGYCISVNLDGSRDMDQVSHLNADQIDNNQLSHKLRPISGIRNHIKRNLASTQTNVDILRDTDLIQRISSVKTLKRLDLSYNNLQTYPRQLCQLTLLETLNLSGNSLGDNEFPLEIEKYQNLIELILDSNSLKRIPKCLTKLKNLSRLSMRKNNLIDLKNIDHFKKLKFLIIEHNSISQLDESLRSLERLEVLNLKSNLINNFDSSLFKLSFNSLKQIDLSFNKISSVQSELFMLPHLELLNVSNNNLNKLPMVPQSFYRAMPIFSIDLSYNHLVRFYDFLLALAKHVDVSHNRIKTIQNKYIQKLTQTQINSKTLRLDANPLIDPPFEICVHGLKLIRDYFEEETRMVQLNKGFKMLILGDRQSGKTGLAYALEDLNSQTNLIEQFNLSNNNELLTESKFMEIHEFSMKSEAEEEDDYVCRKESIYEFSNESNFSSNSAKTFNSTGSSMKKSSKQNIEHSSNQYSTLITNVPNSSNFNSNNNNPIKPVYKSSMQVTIYDFNGSVKQFGHLIEYFIDKSALILICVDSTHLTPSSSVSSDEERKLETYLKHLLDIILLKMNKNNQFYILPVLTKSDKISKIKLLDEQKSYVKSLTMKVENWLKAHVRKRLEDIQVELKKIEQLPQISASQSDRLKHLVQTQANLKPEIHACLSVSSIKMEGVNNLNNAIKEIVCGGKGYFPEVNNKVPTFWIEVEKYVCNDLCEMPATKYLDEDGIQILSNPNLPSLSMLVVDYDYFRERIVEKYGMPHLIEKITRYLHSIGRVVWLGYEPSSCDLSLMKKVFLRPNILFEMLFVLYRTNFAENFYDSHTQALRKKLLKNKVDLSGENLERLKNDLTQKGVLSMDLLKLLWLPILIIESNELVQETFVLFAEYFNIGYPADLSKEKIKILFRKLPKTNNSNNNKSIQNEIERERKKIVVNNMIIPFYLPRLSNFNLIENLRANLSVDCFNAASSCLAAGVKKEMPKLLPKLAHKYVFPWQLPIGMFEKFTTKCILNSDLYYKSHYKNFVLGYNEENTIAALIYVITNNETKPKQDEVVFEFYLINYKSILEEIFENEQQNDENFEQTLTMDLDQIWPLTLKVLQIFEDMIAKSYPSLRFDRFTKCPECQTFSFYSEWITPKELQKLKVQTCLNCSKPIDYSFLVKPTTAHNLTLDIKKLQQRLENITRAEMKHHQQQQQPQSVNPTYMTQLSSTKSDTKNSSQNLNNESTNSQKSKIRFI